MTLATATFLQGLAYLVLPIPGGEVPASLRSLVNGTLWGVPQPLLWCALCAGAVALLLHHTRLGLHLFAVGAQARSAQLNGVPVVAVTVSAYVACSLLAVVAGIYLAARVASAVAVFIKASAVGVVTGALSLGLMTNGINLFGISPFLRGALTGVLLLAAVCAQRRKVVGL